LAQLLKAARSLANEIVLIIADAHAARKEAIAVCSSDQASLI
jgi:hypothetical protein